MNRPLALYLAVVALASLAVPATPESHFLAADWRPSIDAVVADARAMLGWQRDTAAPDGAAGRQAPSSADHDATAAPAGGEPAPGFEHLDLIETPLDGTVQTASYVI